MGQLPYSCHSHHQDAKSGLPGGRPSPRIGQQGGATPQHPQTGQQGPQQPSGQQQTHIPGYQRLSHSMQYSSGYPQSNGLVMQRAGPWQQHQQHPMSQQSHHWGAQQLHSSGSQQSMPEHSSLNGPPQKQSQQSSQLAAQQAAEVKQESPRAQQNANALSQPGAWQSGQPHWALQQGREPHQHLQSMAGALHLQPQSQSDTHRPSSAPSFQDGHQQHGTCPAYGLTMPQQAAQARPLTMQQQFQALQQGSQSAGSAPKPLQNGSAQEQAKSESLSQRGVCPS